MIHLTVDKADGVYNDMHMEIRTAALLKMHTPDALIPVAEEVCQLRCKIDRLILCHNLIIKGYDKMGSIPNYV